MSYHIELINSLNPEYSTVATLSIKRSSFGVMSEHESLIIKCEIEITDSQNAKCLIHDTNNDDSYIEYSIKSDIDIGESEFEIIVNNLFIDCILFIYSE